MIRTALFVLMLGLPTGHAAAAQDSAPVVAPGGAASLPARDGEAVQVPIRLRIDPSIKSRRIREGLKEEAASLWRLYGIRIDWRDAGASDAASDGVLLEASLDRDPERGRNLEWRPILGHADVRPDMRKRRSIHVSFDAVHEVLSLRTNLRTPMQGIVLDHELAIALGRVLAHEIGHVLLGAPYHDRAGLMRASIPPGELAEPVQTRFRLTCSGVDRLRRRFAASIADARRPAEYLASVVGAVAAERELSTPGASCLLDQPASRQ